MNIFTFSTVCFGFSALVIAVLILIRRQDHLGIIYFLFSLCAASWGFFTAFYLSQNYSYSVTLFLARAANISAIFIPSFWLHFVFIFLNHKAPFKHFFIIAYLISSFLLSISGSNLFIPALHSVVPFQYFPSPGILYHVFPTFFFATVILTFIYMMTEYRKAMGQKKYQIKYLVFGTFFGFIGGGATFGYVYRIEVPEWVIILIVFYPFFMGIALIRYGIFDVEQIADAFQREKLAAIGMIATSLNHELRNPLYIAKGRMESYLDAIDRKLYKTEQIQNQASGEMVKISLSQVNRAMEIIQRFSDFAKPMNAVNMKDRVNINQVIDEVLEMVSSELQMQKIRLVKEISNDLYLMVNRRQFEEIIFNLVVNACHAMAEKGGVLTIKSHVIPASARIQTDPSSGGKAGIGKFMDPRSKSEDDRRVLIEISDTGPGIPKENQSRIFEPFFTTKSGKGTGLGLYIVKQLVQRHHGKISIKSQPDKGTTFSLAFPKS